MQMTLAAFVSTLFLLTDASGQSWDLEPGTAGMTMSSRLRLSSSRMAKRCREPSDCRRSTSGQRVEVRLTGTFDDGVLKITGEVENAKEPTDRRHRRPLWRRRRARRTLALHGRSIPWTAERLKERKLACCSAGVIYRGASCCAESAPPSRCRFDAMSAGGARRRAERAQSPAGLRRDGARRGRQLGARYHTASLGSGRGRARFRPWPDQPRLARALPSSPDDRQQHRLLERRTVHRRRNRRRPLPLERRVPDPGASAPEPPGADVEAGTSLDQLYATASAATAIPSLQLCIENVDCRRRLRLQLFVRVHRHASAGRRRRARCR